MKTNEREIGRMEGAQEFAKKLKKEIRKRSFSAGEIICFDKMIDDLLKEMEAQGNRTETFHAVLECSEEAMTMTRYDSSNIEPDSDEYSRTDELTIEVAGKKVGEQLMFDEWQKIKRRPDYKFTLEITEDTLQELRHNRMDSFMENGDPIRGAAVLEIGHIDLEVNIHAACQTAHGEPEDKTPQVSYFCCIKRGETDDTWESDDYVCNVTSVDWNAADWKEQLEFNMFYELEKYRKEKGYSYDSPN